MTEPRESINATLLLAETSFKIAGTTRPSLIDEVAETTVRVVNLINGLPGFGFRFQ